MSSATITQMHHYGMLIRDLPGGENRLFQSIDPLAGKNAKVNQIGSDSGELAAILSGLAILPSIRFRPFPAFLNVDPLFVEELKRMNSRIIALKIASIQILKPRQEIFGVSKSRFLDHRHAFPQGNRIMK
jgi:hypothetical protein